MIKFDPIKHSYIDDKGRKYKSVTTIINEIYPFNVNEIIAEIIVNPNSAYYQWTPAQVKREWRQSAIEGSRVHKAIENFINKNEFPKNIDIIPLVKQFKKLHFKGKLKTELKVWDEDLLIAGTVDLLEDCGNYFWLWDLKTSKKLSDDRLIKFSMQLELYKRLVEKKFKKSVKIGGIIFFENYVKLRKNTKISIFPVLNCTKAINNIISNRKKELKI